MRVRRFTILRANALPVTTPQSSRLKTDTGIVFNESLILHVTKPAIVSKRVTASKINKSYEELQLTFRKGCKFEIRPQSSEFPITDSFFKLAIRPRWVHLHMKVSNLKGAVYIK